MNGKNINLVIDQYQAPVRYVPEESKPRGCPPSVGTPKDQHTHAIALNSSISSPLSQSRIIKQPISQSFFKKIHKNKFKSFLSIS